MEDLITQEIGSFRKPTYLSSKFRSYKGQEFEKVAKKATLETLDLFSKSGLMNIGVGGEMYRWEMYEHPIARMSGVEIFGPVRSFDNRYYNKGSVYEDISRKEPFHIEEIRLFKELGMNNIKIPVTGPYTLMDWSFNDHYKNRADLALAFGRIMNQEIRELKSAWGDGILQIQIDEPAATTHPEEMDIVLDSVNESVKGIEGIETHLHVCYSSDYGLLFNIVPSLNVSVYNLEFANRDPVALGEDRKGYDDVRRFKETADVTTREISLGLGVTDIHRDFLEPPSLIKERIEFALKFMEPDRLRINPDCGLRTRSREVGFEKLKNMDLARDEVVKTL
ncbi:MAG: methionine synthase [Thermoplasmatales archaeon]|nr:methionine synthase [Candidatus Thermoplasmatota archaeon]MCL6003057.1 methionine synthase [Candidatus Thermoplasmatota archaeon]MDA8054168.1 methionine synthase [Thermoplasmatales archaeon]